MDHLEIAPLYLGKSQSDRNTERISLLSEIDVSLADYGTKAFTKYHKLRNYSSANERIDQFIERTRRINDFGPACPRDIESLNNWLESAGSLAREETAYLAHSHELISLAPTGDSAMMQLETWVEDKFNEKLGSPLVISSLLRIVSFQSPPLQWLLSFFAHFLTFSLAVLLSLHFLPLVISSFQLF